MFTPGDPNTPHPYSPADEARIRQDILTNGRRPTCPLCGKTLTSDMPRGGRCSHQECWELHCVHCHRSIIVEDSLHA